jgi:hypothetical protein
MSYDLAAGRREPRQLLLLIFILENGQQANIGFFGAHGHLPLGIALLLAAILGVLAFARHHREVHIPLIRHLPGPPRYTAGRDVAALHGAPC